MRKLRAEIVAVLLTAGIFVSSAVQADPGRAIDSAASGTGAYLPATGQFFGPGSDPTLGNLIYSGHLELKALGNGKFQFQNAGRGTDEEVLQQTIFEDGSSFAARFIGQVELVPELDESGTPTNRFTAEWTGRWTVVGGTGKLRGARGTVEVTAINSPFQLTDLQWNFSWAWSGRIRVVDDPLAGGEITRLQTGGEGVFDPANLGVGNPLTFPLVIGDGSGAGVYDGTPTGFEFRLNGELVGDGFDQHFGVSQSLISGFVSPKATIWYLIESGENPDGSGRRIHIMKTRVGEIWFRYDYGFFELDFLAGQFTGLADFRVVGGTGEFENATGSVYVKVVSDVEDITGLPLMPVAPFRYDFNGYLELAE